MICKNCQTYYVRDPCPNCGHNSEVKENRETDEIKDEDEQSTVKPSQIREKEESSGNQVLMQKQEEEEENLVKPSQRFKQEQKDNDDIPSFQRFEQKEENDEELVKPSDRARQEQSEEDIPSFQRFGTQDKDEELRKTPNKQELDEEDIPSFQRYQQEDEVDISTFSTKLNRPDQQEKLKNDIEYRNKVKETLEEVMGLLEKLIDDE